jgi:hypothetical protein
LSGVGADSSTETGLPTDTTLAVNESERALGTRPVSARHRSSNCADVMSRSSGSIISKLTSATLACVAVKPPAPGSLLAWG